MTLCSVLFIVLLGLVSAVCSEEFDDVKENTESYGSFLCDLFEKEEGKKKKKEEVKFLLYNKNSEDNPEICHSYDNTTFKNLLSEKPIKFIINGWKGHANSTFNRVLVNGFLAHNDVNIISVDWSGYGSKAPWYPCARKRVPKVAAIVANFINRLHDQHGSDLDQIHIIGHSLGAHIAGIAGYLVTTGSIGRITGLDPAYPLFSVKKFRERLSTDSATFVDIIHTSFKGFGTAIGHADFFPNGLHMFQPGCRFDTIGKCSHGRAFLYYAESLSRPQTFLAVPCSDWLHFTRKECDALAAVPMGEYTPRTAKGTYFLTTNSQSPFGRDIIWS